MLWKKLNKRRRNLQGVMPKFFSII